jgi:hypothetical protein
MLASPSSSWLSYSKRQIEFWQRTGGDPEFWRMENFIRLVKAGR